MSASPTTAQIQPLHNPLLAAQVVVPEAPLGNTVKQAPGTGVKALFGKKFAHNANPAFISPTDSMMTPCTQKLNAAKKKHFNKLSKPVQLFSSQKSDEEDLEANEDCGLDTGKESSSETMQVDDENPF